MGWLSRLFGSKERDRNVGHSVAELARRLGVTEAELRAIRPTYHPFSIPKRSGGTREISAPDVALKRIQRRILRRLLSKLHSHPAATGFERGHSIVTNAVPHAGKGVVLRLDLKDFFHSTTATRVEAYFRYIGWNAEAAELLSRLVTHEGRLPQGAPTSPRLSNLLNVRLDHRLAKIAERASASYSRYADDITFSLTPESGAAQTQWMNPKTLANEKGRGNLRMINWLIQKAKAIVREEGYELHLRKKLVIARSHQRQLVTGLVVNQKVDLPRATRRRLRAIEHHLANGRPASLTLEQLKGWRALRQMISTQSQTA